MRNEVGDVNWLLGKKVLVVDDDEMIRDSMRLFFESDGCHYRSVERAEHGLEELASASFDLIISDYKLPGMSGLEFFDRIRMSHPTVAKILITAYANSGLFTRATQMGVSRCIEKPLTAERIETCLTLIMKTRTPQAQKRTRQT